MTRQRPDGVVLLAPACASFDWFRDYAERGAAFKEEVERLKRDRVDGQRTRRKASVPRQVSREQSSVGLARVGAYRWERRLTPVCEVGVLFHEPADDC